MESVIPQLIALIILLFLSGFFSSAETALTTVSAVRIRTMAAEGDKRAARVERVTAALDEKRAEYVHKRDTATLPSTKAIYQAFIDAIDRIKERLEREGN